MICQCGCGEEAGVYTQTHGSRGVVKGEARRFKHGHRRTPVCKHGHPRVPDNITTLNNAVQYLKKWETQWIRRNM